MDPISIFNNVQEVVNISLSKYFKIYAWPLN